MLHVMLRPGLRVKRVLEEPRPLPVHRVVVNGLSRRRSFADAALVRTPLLITVSDVLPLSRYPPITHRAGERAVDLALDQEAVARGRSNAYLDYVNIRPVVASRRSCGACWSRREDAGRIATRARRTTLHLSSHAPWAGLLLDAVTRLRVLAAPG
jgi:hypothetical protein